MKTNFNIKAVLASIILLITIAPVNIFASDGNGSLIVNSNTGFLNTTPDYMYIAALNDANAVNAGDTASGNSGVSDINWHKIFGYSTLGMMAVTISAGFLYPGDVHCALAGVTTGLAASTCAIGIYEYGGLISFTDGDWHYNVHALLGVLATGGFITTLALADGDAHVATGIASGTAFTVALGVIYFQ